MIQVSHEMPLYMLQNGDEAKYNDYGYALVHLFETDPAYYNYYVETLKTGRKVYLDNSIFELDTAFNSDRFVYWLKKLAYDSGSDYITYIIPDVLDNSVETINNAIDFCKKYSSLPGTNMCVMQGTSFQELVDCYVAFKNLNVDYYGVSFNCKAYDTYLPSIENNLERWKKARQDFVDFLYLYDPYHRNTSLHLLGCALPDEFKHYTNSRLEDFIQSIDTSNPVVHGLLGIKYESDFGLKRKESTKLCDLLNTKFESTNYSTIMYNIQEFRRINNL